MHGSPRQYLYSIPLRHLYIIQSVFETDRTPAPSLDVRSASVVLGLYFAFTAVWITRFVLRFRR